MKNSSQKKEQNFGRKVAVYIVVGVITFTMIFSVFAGLVAAIN